MTTLVSDRGAVYRDPDIHSHRQEYENIITAYNQLNGVQKMLRDVIIEPAYATGNASNTVTDFMIDVRTADDVVNVDAPHLKVLHQSILTAMGYSDTSNWKSMPGSYTIPTLVTDQEYATYSSLYSTISTYLGYVKSDVENASSGSQTGTQGQREYYYLQTEYGLKAWNYYETVLLKIQEQLDRQKVRQIKARDAALIDEIDQYALTVTNDQPHYFSGDAGAALTNSRAQSVMGTLRGDYESLTNGTFLSYIVAEVMAETSPTRAMTTAEIGIHADRLNDELKVRNYEPNAAQWIAWYTSQNNVVLATASDATIESMISSAKTQRNAAWNGYVDLYNNATSGEAQYGPEQANEVFYDDVTGRSTDADYEALIDKEFEELFSRLRPEVNRVYEIYAQYDSVDSRNFAWLIYEIPTLKNSYTSLYNFLVATTYGSNGLDRMNNASHGVNGAKSVKAEWDMMASLLQQAQNVRDSKQDPTRLNKEIAGTQHYTVREGDSELDLAREDGEDYEVTNTRVSNSIAQIDNFLTGGDFANKLLNLEKADGTAYTNTSGQPVANLAELIDAVMRDKLYSDKIINMIIKLLYPNVTSTILYQIYSRLYGPEGILDNYAYRAEIDQIKTIDLWLTTVDIHYGVRDLAVYLYLNGKSYGGHQSLPLPQLLKNAGLYLYPSTLAEKINSTFPAKAQLQSAASWSGNSYDFNPYFAGIPGDWCHTNLSTGEIDAYNPTIFAATETDEYEVGDCKLVWNINGSKDRFELALADIFESLLPVLQLALGGKSEYTASLNNALVVEADGEAYASRLASANFNNSSAYNVRANAKITAKQNGETLNGYNNILAPLFEALGVTDYTAGGYNVTLSNPGGSGSGADYARSVINPLQALINQLSNSPVDKILSMLPNVAYFLSYGMIEPLLKGISLSIKVNLDGLDLSLDLGNFLDALVDLIGPIWDAEEFVAGKINEAINGFLADPFEIDLSGLIDLAELLDCNDITNVNSILKSVLAKADNENLQALVDSLPFIDVGQLMSMGSYVKNASSIRTTNRWGDGAGKRRNITADKPDVFWYLLQYVGEAVAKPEFKNAIKSFIKSDEDETPGEPSMLDKILNSLGNDPDMVGAALIELLQPQRYSYERYNWQHTAESESGVKGVDGVYLKYANTNMWTADKAKYTYENIDDIVNSLTSGDKDVSFTKAIREALSGIYSKNLILTLGGVFSKISELTETSPLIESVFKNDLGIDTDVWAPFEDADLVDSWSEALKELKKADPDDPEQDPATVDSAANWPAGMPSYMYFENGDQAAFRTALTTVLTPLSGVLGYLLAGENISALTGRNGNKCLTLLGEEGYVYGLLPLLEGLGINAPKTTSEFRSAANGNYLGYLLDLVFDRMNYLLADTTDTIAELTEILPQLLYLIDTDALPTMVINLLKAPLITLDTARPIIPVWADILLPMINEALADNPIPKLTRAGDDEEDTPENSYTLQITSIQETLSCDNILRVLEGITDLQILPLFKNALNGLVLGNLQSYGINGNANTETNASFRAQDYYKVKLTQTMGDGNLHNWDIITWLLEVAIELGIGGEGYATGATHNETALATILVNKMPALEGKTVPEVIDAIAEIKKVLMGQQTLDPSGIDWTYFDEDGSMGDSDVWGVGEVVDTKNNTETERSVYKLDDIYNDWTEETSLYIVQNIDAVLNEVLGAAGLSLKVGETEVEITSLDDIATNLSSLVYTNSTLTAIVKAVSGVLDGDEENDGINPALIDALGVFVGAPHLTVEYDKDGDGTDDIVSCFYQAAHDVDAEGVHNFGFTDGDKDGFIGALSDLLVPLNNVLRWYLLGQDMEFFYGSEEGGIASVDGGKMFTVKGNNAYNTAIIPLLEAIGATPTATADELLAATATADGTASSNNAIIRAIIDPIANLIDNIAADPTTLLDYVPNFVYFVNAGGLTSIAENALFTLLDVVFALNKVIGFFAEEPDEGEEPKDMIDLSKVLTPLGFNAETGTLDLSFDHLIPLIEQLLAKDKVDKETGEVTEAGVAVDLTTTLLPLLKTYFVGSLVPATSVNGSYILQMKVMNDNDRAENLTVLLCAVLDVVRKNGALIEKLTKGKITEEGIDSINTVLSGITPVYAAVDWFKFNDSVKPDDFDSQIEANGKYFDAQYQSIAHVSYPNDWTKEKADYFNDNVADLVDSLIAEKTDYSDLADLIDKKTVEIYTNENLTKIAVLVAGLSGKLTEALGDSMGLSDTIITLAEQLLGIDLHIYETYVAEDYDWGVDSADTREAKAAAFKEGLVTLLTPVGRILEWLFFGDDYNYLNTDNPELMNTATATTNDDYAISLKGGEAYYESLLPLYMGLGVAPEEAVPTDREARVRAIAEPIVDLIEKITADPVDEGLALLNNLIYWLNTGAVKACVNNMLAPITAITDELNRSGILQQPLDVQSLLADQTIPLGDREIPLGDLPLFDLDTEHVLAYVESLTGLKLNSLVVKTVDGVEMTLTEYLVKHMCGYLEPYTSPETEQQTTVLGLPNTAYIMKFSGTTGEGSRADFLTEIVSIILQIALDDQNVGPIVNLLTTYVEQFNGDANLAYETFNSIKTLISGVDFADAGEAQWLYFVPADNSELAGYATGSDKQVVPYLKSYDQGINDWSKDAAAYIQNNAGEIVDFIIRQIAEDDSATLGSFLADKIDDFYKEETLTKIASKVNELLPEFNQNLYDLIGKMFALDFGAIEANAAVTDWNGDGQVGTLTAEEFKAAIYTLVAPLGDLIDWLIYGDPMRFFVTTDGSDIITVNGVETYNYSLVPIFEAIGATPMEVSDIMAAAQAAYDAELAASGDADAAYRKSVEVKVGGVVDPLIDRITVLTSLSSDLLIYEVETLVNNLLYFIEAGGLKSSVGYLLASVDVVLDALAPFVEIDLDDLFTFDNDGTEVTIPVDDMSAANVRELIRQFTGIDTETPIGHLLAGYITGKVTPFTSINDRTAAKLVFSDDIDGAAAEDFLTAALTYVLLVFNHPNNAEAMKNYIGEDTYTLIYRLLHEGIIPAYSAVDWFRFNDSVKPDDFDYQIEANGKYFDAQYQSIAHVSYPNDWTAEKADYVSDNIAEIVDSLIADYTDYDDLSDLIISLTDTVYTDETLTKIAGLVAGLSGRLTEALGDSMGALSGNVVRLAELLLHIDLQVYDTYAEGYDWGVDSAATHEAKAAAFREGLVTLLMPVGRVLEWLFFGEDYRYLPSDNPQLAELGIEITNDDYGLVLKGIESYYETILPLYMGLGVAPEEDVPGDTEARVRAIAEPLVNLVEKITANPVDEALALLNNLIYWLNTGAFKVCISNVLAPINAITGELNSAGLLEQEIDIPAMLAGVTVDIGNTTLSLGDIPIFDLDTEHILAFVETLTGLRLSSLVVKTVDGEEMTLAEYLVKHMCGYLEAVYSPAVEHETTVFGESNAAYVMRFSETTGEGSRADFLTEIVSIALQVALDDQNEGPIVNLLANFVPAFNGNAAEAYKLFKALKSFLNGEIAEAEEAEWLYFVPAANEGLDSYSTPADEQVVNYLGSYEQEINCWSEETAAYIQDYADEIADLIIRQVAGDNSATLSTYLTDLINGLYKEETLTKIASAVSDVLPDINQNLYDLIGKMFAVDFDAVNANAAITDWNGDGSVGTLTPDEFKAAIHTLVAPLGDLIDWLFYGDPMKFFVTTDSVDIISIAGIESYNYSLVPIYEAIGATPMEVEDIMADAQAAYDAELEASGDAEAAYRKAAEVKVGGVIDPLIDRVTVLSSLSSDLLVYEVETLVNNVIYFIEAGGLKSAVGYLMGSVETVINTVAPFTGKSADDIFTFAINGKDVTIPVTDMSAANVRELIKQIVGIDLETPIGHLLADYITGEVTPFTSINDRTAAKLVFSDDIDGAAAEDFLTAMVTYVLLVFNEPNNAEFLKSTLGEDTYISIYNLLHLEDIAPFIDINWQNLPAGSVWNPVNAGGSAYFANDGYGRYWTREKAEYVNEHLTTCLDSLIHLLGLPAGSVDTEGLTVENLKDLLNDRLMNGNLYSDSILSRIGSRLGSLLERLDDINGESGREFVINVLKSSLGIDLTYYYPGYANSLFDSNYNWIGGSVTDKESFKAALVQLLAPLGKVLKWLLAEGKEFNIEFINNNENGGCMVILPCASAYTHAIIPLLEALGCSAASIKSGDEFNADARGADGNAAIVEDILDPLLDRIDEIMADPADQIFDILANVFYFIDSEGLNAVFQNVLHSVSLVLGSVLPLVDKDKYGAVENYNTSAEAQEAATHDAYLWILSQIKLPGGVALTEDTLINYNTIVSMILGSIESSTGFELTPVVIDAVVELTCGMVEENTETKTALNDGKSYRVVYTDEANRVDMVTLVLRLACEFIATGDNAEKIKAIITESDMNEDAKKYVIALIDALVDSIEKDPVNHIDVMLGTLYYFFYAIDKGAEGADNWLNDLNDDWTFVTGMMVNSESDLLSGIFSAFFDEVDTDLGGIVDSQGLASNGLIPFFQRIVEIFQKIIAFFTSLFGG
ncbi:MAG: hypothetical protein K6G71_06975 [Clostridiales bacterium]|nr:hypothetical protein [Clostridiales bacterium]